jgi:O-methyltransferase
MHEDLYLDLLKRCLTRTLFPDGCLAFPSRPARRWKRLLASAAWPMTRRALAAWGLMLTPCYDASRREVGGDWPAEAETMIGLRRLDHLQACLETVLREKIAGDVIETGVWRGGAAIFMRAVLAAHRDPSRCVWVADSFQGLPRPDAGRYPADTGSRLWSRPELAVPLETVKANFAKYGLLDERVHFLVGWFRDTLPSAPIEDLAILRMDGDMYESTIDALRALYPRLSPGGFAIVDDYFAVWSCAAAVDDYRREHAITEPMVRVDTSMSWRKARG